MQNITVNHHTDELLQCFEESGAPAARSVPRTLAHQEGILHGASHTYIYKWENDSLFILLQRRSLEKDSFPGCLDTSSAGHIVFGSDFLKTAQTELSEELGISIEPESLEHLFDQKIHAENSFHGRRFVDHEINRIYALNLNCDTSALRLQPEEVSEVLWMNADAILAALDESPSELCMSKEEMKKVIACLQ